jgi:hypothetical protein
MQHMPQHFKDTPLRAVVPPLQVLSNSSVSSGVGVYWMFYSGGDYEPVEVPSCLPGQDSSSSSSSKLEGLRMRPGLAMSQVRAWW